jgi:glutaryl-CoA dehydrogenase
MITTARKTKDGWVLNGTKMWITNGSMARIAIVWAQTGEIGDTRGIRGFLVPTDTPGFTARDQKGKLSLLASDTSNSTCRTWRFPTPPSFRGQAG